MIASRIEMLTRCYFGGGGSAQPTPPPAPPSKDAAADAGKDVGGNKRRGYQSTILGGRKTAAAEDVTGRKTLLGQ